MRIAIIVVSMLVLAAPTHASNSCMSKAEARQHFASTRIYWHGPDHCWDATPPQHHQVRNLPATSEKAGRNDDPPKWREAMSEMSPDGQPVQPQEVRPSGGDDGGGAAASSANWSDRWVDVAQVAPRALIEGKPEPVAASPAMVRAAGPVVTPRDLVLVFVAFILTLVMVELLLRGSIYRRRR